MGTSGLPRRVLFLTYGFSLGGAETLFVRLVNALDRGVVDPAVVTLAEGDLRKGLRPDVPVIPMLRQGKLDFSPARTLARSLNDENIDTVLVLGFFAFMYLKRALRTVRHPVRSFVWTHGTRPRTVKEFLQMAAYTRMLSRGDQIITICRAQAEYLQRLYRIPSRYFTTIYNGIDTTWWNLPPAEFNRSGFRESLGIPSNASVVVQVAMFRPEKRQEDVVRALRLLHRSSSLRPYLLFVGDGRPNFIEAVRRITQKSGLSHYVRFLGRQQDVRPFLWSSDLLTMASVSETFPNVALEALACGVPCVLTDVGGAREIITDGKLGTVVPPRDPVALAGAWAGILQRECVDRQHLHAEVAARFPVQGFVHHFEDVLAGEQ